MNDNRQYKKPHHHHHHHPSKVNHNNNQEYKKKEGNQFSRPMFTNSVKTEINNDNQVDMNNMRNKNQNYAKDNDSFRNKGGYHFTNSNKNYDRKNDYRR